MKYIVLTFIFLSLTTLGAQTLDISEGQIVYDDENVSTIRIITEPEVSLLKDKFSDWLDDNYDVNLDKKKLLFFNKEFMSAKGVTIKRISNKKIDLLFKINEKDSGKTQIDAFSSFGYNNWITPNTYPQEYYAFEELVYDFIRDYLPEHYKNRIYETEEVLLDLKENKKEYEEEISENEKEIEELMKENQELLNKLKNNNNKINSTKVSLLKRNKAYNSMTKKVSKIK